MKKIVAVLVLMLGLSMQAQALNYDNLHTLIESHPSWTGPGSVDIPTLDAYADTTQTSFPDLIPSVEIWRSIINNPDEYEALSDVRRDLIRTTIKGGGVNEVDVRSDTDGSGTDSPERKLLISTFGAGSDTIGQLVSKFQEITPIWVIYNVGQNPDPEDFQEAIDTH